MQWWHWMRPLAKFSKLLWVRKEQNTNTEYISWRCTNSDRWSGPTNIQSRRPLMSKWDVFRWFTVIWLTRIGPSFSLSSVLCASDSFVCTQTHTPLTTPNLGRERIVHCGVFMLFKTPRLSFKWTKANAFRSEKGLQNSLAANRLKHYCIVSHLRIHVCLLTRR